MDNWQPLGVMFATPKFIWQMPSPILRINSWPLILKPWKQTSEHRNFFVIKAFRFEIWLFNRSFLMWFLMSTSFNEVVIHLPHRCVISRRRLDAMIIAQVCLRLATIKCHCKMCSFHTEHAYMPVVLIGVVTWLQFVTVTDLNIQMFTFNVIWHFESCFFTIQGRWQTVCLLSCGHFECTEILQWNPKFHCFVIYPQTSLHGAA